MSKSKMQEETSTEYEKIEDVISELGEREVNNPDELNVQMGWWQNCARFFKEFRIAAEEIKREYWESQEISSAVLAMSELREFFHRFPKLEKSYTSIKANVPAPAGLYHLLLSESMLKLFLSALLREVEFDVIAKLAPTSIDKAIFKLVMTKVRGRFMSLEDLRQAVEELDKKLNKKLIDDKHAREELFQELFWKEAQKWTEEKPYAEFVQNVLGAFFNATLPEFAKKDLIDEDKAEHRKKRCPSGGYEPLDEPVETDRGTISRHELLEQTEPALQTQPNLEFLDWEALLAELDDEDERRLIEFLIEGYTQVEISKKLRRSQSWVSKKLRKIAKKIAKKVAGLE